MPPSNILKSTAGTHPFCHRTVEQQLLLNGVLNTSPYLTADVRSGC